MNNLLAGLNVLYVKVHNYHYNVVGNEFLETHLALEAEYNMIHGWIDQVAEAIKIEGEYPAATMEEYLKLATIKETASQDYTKVEIFTSLIADYTQLLADIADIKQTASSTVVNTIEPIEDYLKTKLWFFKAQVK